MSDGMAMTIGVVGYFAIGFALGCVATWTAARRGDPAADLMMPLFLLFWPLAIPGYLIYCVATAIADRARRPRPEKPEPAPVDDGEAAGRLSLTQGGELSHVGKERAR